MDLAIKSGGIPFESQYSYSPFALQSRDICKTQSLFKISLNYRMSFYNINDQ